MKKESFDSYSDKEEETKINSQMLNIDKVKSDSISIASLESASSPNTRILALEKQLNIEQKVCEGAKNMLEMYSKNKNKKFMKEAKNMLDYSQAKIDYIKMMIDKLKEHNDKRIKKSNTDEKSAMNLKLLQFESLVDQANATSEKQDQLDNDAFKMRFLQFQSKSSSCLPNNTADAVIDEEMTNLIEREKLFSLRIEELKARLKLELTLMDGLKNIILTLQADKTDKNTIQDAKSKLIESYQKVYLLRAALKSILDKLDSKSSKYESINNNLQMSRNASTDLKAKSVYTSLPTDFNERINLDELKKQSQFVLPKAQQICGRLEIKLVGVKNLLAKIERYDSERSISSSSSKKSNYKINDTISNEIKAVLKLDNIKVAETTFQRISENCFNSLGFFPVDLDRNRELELQFYYNDYREFCAFKHLYLEDYVENEFKEEIDLEPQGSLMIEIRILHPMIISSKNNRIQRKKLLRFKSETFLRPNQMNINVATWSRLLQGNVFDNQKSSAARKNHKSFASFTPESRKKLDERSSSSDSSTSLCKLRIDKTRDLLEEEDEDDLSDEEMNEKPKIKEDKLEFIKKLKAQSQEQDRINEIEVESLSTSEEEVDLIDMRVTVDEKDDKKTKKGLIKSKTENLKSKPTMRQIKKDLDFKQTAEIESISSSDDESTNDLNNYKNHSKDEQSNIIELDDDDDLVDTSSNLLSKLNISNYDKNKESFIFDKKDEDRWETKDLKLNDFTFICTLGRGEL